MSLTAAVAVFAVVEQLLVDLGQLGIFVGCWIIQAEQVAVFLVICLFDAVRIVAASGSGDTQNATVGNEIVMVLAHDS